MAHLYHSTCYWSRWRRFVRWLRGEKGMPRFIYEPHVKGGTNVDKIMYMQTFRCQSCGDTINFDTDWADEKGGFIGNAVEENIYRKKPKVPDSCPAP